MSAQFVDGWTIAQVLGEGAFGEVKLLINDETRDVLAVKIINTDLHAEARFSIRKEIAIHRALSHPNVIKYFGHRTENGFEYIFLEYASGGELFNKIEPDVGMKLWEAQKYFTQLISGVEYLHTRGISHRDIKPENILLDDNDDVKISDFGMATMFRKNGMERLLDKKCGTMPYVAPEVLLRPYKAIPADIWSCGIVLVAMLAGGKLFEMIPVKSGVSGLAQNMEISFGLWYPSRRVMMEIPRLLYPRAKLNLLSFFTGIQSRSGCAKIKLPWDSPASTCKEFVSWKNNVITLSPWNKLDNNVLNLLRKILTPLPEKRLTATQILKHRWCAKAFPNEGAFRNITPAPKKLYSGTDLSPSTSLSDEGFSRLCYTQPMPAFSDFHDSKVKPDRDQDEAYDSNKIYCFSQPAHIDDLLLSSQLHCTQAATSLNSYQKLVRRMTRFFVSTDVETSISKVVGVLESFACSWKRGPPFVLTFTTIDRRKNNLIFKANVIEMGGKVLLDFRLSRGCGLEFKKLFMKTKESLGDLVLKGPVLWSINAAEANSEGLVK